MTRAAKRIGLTKKKRDATRNKSIIAIHRKKRLASNAPLPSRRLLFEPSHHVLRLGCLARGRGRALRPGGAVRAEHLREELHVRRVVLQAVRP